MYFVWYDNDKKKPASAKIAEASERFVEKYGQSPALVLVHPAERVENVDLPVLPRPTVGKDQFWLGDQEEMPAQVAGAA